MNTPVESYIACLYFFLAACLTKDTLPAGHQFMINLLVSSLMADQGLENALITAIAYEVKDPAAILKKDRESSVHLLDLVRQLLGNASSTQTASLKHVCNIYNYVILYLMLIAVYHQNSLNMKKIILIVMYAAR